MASKLLAALPKKPPPDAGAAVGLQERPLVLAVGPVPGAVVRRVEAGGYMLERASDVLTALRAMARVDYTVVLVAPSIEAEADGVRLVRGIVHRESALTWDGGALGRRYDEVPFVLLPVAGSTEYAVVIGQEVVLRDAVEAPIGVTVVGLGRSGQTS